MKGLVFSPGGRCIALGSNSKTVDVWDAGKEEVMCLLEGHLRWPTCVLWDSIQMA